MSKRRRPKAPPVVFLMPCHWVEFELSDDHLEEAESGVEADGEAAAGAGTSGEDRHLDSDGLEGKG